MKEKITIHDIARILEVSPSTVSRALNDNPRISANTRKAVQELALEHGYQPNGIASSLRKGKTFTIGVVIPRINRHFFSNVIGGMEEVLNGAGYNLLICQSQEDFLKEQANLNSLVSLRVDAIFISMAAGSKDSAHIKELIDKGTRIIMFDRVDEKIHTPKVVLNDFLGAYLIVEELVSEGYRNIYHFAGPENIAVYRDRKRGYEEAMKKNRLKYNNSMIRSNIITKEKAYEALNSILNNGEMPDAIFSASDFSALGAMIALRERNISVPDQMGIAGFGNEPFTEFMQPGITSIDQKANLMGQKVARLFLNEPDSESNFTEIISPEIIVRKSTMKLSIN